MADVDQRPVADHAEPDATENFENSPLFTTAFLFSLAVLN